jgi:ligand-binding sensor domain-containing protein
MKNHDDNSIASRAFARTFLILSLFILLFSGSLRAQYFEIEHYTSGSDVIDIARQGDDLWTVNFRGGLTRLNVADGTMTHFNHVNSALLTNYVNCVRIAPNGDVWAGTNYGLARYDGQSWTIYRSNNSPLSNIPQIADIVIDGNNIIWIASGSTLFRFDGDKSWQLFSPGNSPLPSGMMSSLALDVDGSLWIGYKFGTGVVHYNGSNWIHYTTSNSGLADGWINHIWVDPQGSKWFASASSVGLSRYDGTSWTQLGPNDSPLLSGYVNAMAFPAAGGMWIGSNAGLQFFDGFTWTNYTLQNSPIPGSGVMSLSVGADNQLWIGFSHGVSWEQPIAVDEVASLARLTGSTWQFYSVGNSPLPSGWVERIVMDAAGYPWINTYGGGAIHFDGMDWDWKHLGNSPMPGSYISDAAVDHENSLWLAIDGYGLTRKKGNQWSVFNSSNSQFPSYWPSAIATAPDNSLWIGTGDGHLVNNNGMDWITYHPSQTPLPESRIAKIVVDTMNEVWLSYYSWLFPGLMRYSGGTFTHFTEANSALPSDVILDMVVDADNQVWFATQAGLVRYHEMTWEVFTSDNSPLPSSVIRSLALNADGLLWIYTHAGIMAFDRADKWTLFTSAVDGSADDDKYPLHMQADPDGRLWVGTLSGVLVLDAVFPVPEIGLSVGELLFDSVAIGDCAIRVYDLFATALDEALLIQAPDGFTLAVHPDSVFVGTQLFAPDNGAIEQTVYVAFCPTEAKHYQDAINHDSEGAATRVLSVGGVGYIPTSLDPSGVAGRLNMYPNPAKRWVVLEMEDEVSSPKTHDWDIRVFTLSGQLVHHQVWAQDTHIVVLDVAHLPGGMYFVDIRSKESGHLLALQRVMLID